MSSVLSGTVSLAFRALSYSLLRLIPGQQGLACLALFGLYLIAWVYNDAKISYAEESPARTIAKQSKKAQKRLSKGLPVTLKPHSTDSTIPGAPSYSQVVKEATKDNESLTTADPPLPIELRGVAIPGRPSILSFITGAHTQSRVANRVSLLINFLLVLACLDLQFAPIFFDQHKDLAFVRVGGIGDTWANLVARIPPVDLFTVGNNTQVATGAKVLYRLTQPVGAWQTGPLLLPSNETDWTASAQLTDLYPSTQYEYRLVLPQASTTVFHPHFKSAQRFTTWTDPRLTAIKNGAGTHFKFAATSCMIPYWPYRPFRFGKERLRMKGVEYLADTVKTKAIDFLLFMGDAIYADVPFYAGNKLETYLRKYRQIYASESYRRIYEHIPTLQIYDDHEISNDYSASSDNTVYQTANRAFRLYHGSANPTVPGLSLESEPVNYFWFRHGDAAFFVFDTRKYRSANDAVDDEHKTMLGATQKRIFNDWLATVNQTVTWKFVVSSVPFMTLWDSGVASAKDTFAAFTHERSELLDAMEYVPNVIVLSGDRHEFAAASMRHKVLEFSTSPLHQFYLPIRTLSQSHGLGATGEDILLKYLPDGNSKFTTFEVDTRVQNKPVVKVEVTIDGKEAWTCVGSIGPTGCMLTVDCRLEIQGKPVHAPPIQVGRLAPTLAELLGFLKRKWF